MAAHEKGRSTTHDADASSRRPARRATSAPTVVVCGWVANRRDHGGMVFLDVRDVGGLVQVVVDPDAAGLRASRTACATSGCCASSARCGRVPTDTVNAGAADGRDRGRGDREIEVLNESEPPPFPLDDRVDVDEVLRLRHRYLDLRRAPMQRNLRLRAAVNRALREAMAAQDFVEIETPMLIASTPEGARDFVVPSRLRPGTFYALPQSPQLFKQLLMVGGFDRYFQIARCLARRRPARRPPVRVHAARRRDDVRRPGGRARRGLASRCSPRPRPCARAKARTTIPRMTWHRGDGALRHRQARHCASAWSSSSSTEVFAATEFKAFAGGRRGQGHLRRRARATSVARSSTR